MERKLLVYVLAGCALVELGLFVWLCSLGQETFRSFVWAADTGSYVQIALGIVDKGELIPSPRTLGYPLFLAFGYFLGGAEYGPHIIVAAQLLINLLLTAGCWRLLEKVTPNTGLSFRAAVTILLFWAGLGMALSIMSDFLAAFFFGVFLYGMLFHRSWPWVLITATSVALATLIRPTFTFLPLIIPVAAYFVGRFTSRLPLSHIAIFMAFSMIATGISILYQYQSFGYGGPSDIVTKNIGRTLHYLHARNGDEDIDYDGFTRKLAERAGDPAANLSATEQQKEATRMLVEELTNQPGVVLLQLFTTIIKYLFVPVELLLVKWVGFYVGANFYSTYVRPILALLWLPVWLLALAPPAKATAKEMGYYFVVMMFLFYIVGLTAVNPVQGERIRFPALPFMMPLFALNLSRVFSFLAATHSARRRRLPMQEKVAR